MKLAALISHSAQLTLLTGIQINTPGSAFQSIYFDVHFLIGLSFPRQSWGLVFAEGKLWRGVVLKFLPKSVLCQ